MISATASTILSLPWRSGRLRRLAGGVDAELAAGDLRDRQHARCAETVASVLAAMERVAVHLNRPLARQGMRFLQPGEVERPNWRFRPAAEAAGTDLAARTCVVELQHLDRAEVVEWLACTIFAAAPPGIGATLLLDENRAESAASCLYGQPPTGAAIQAIIERHMGACAVSAAQTVRGGTASHGRA